MMMKLLLKMIFLGACTLMSSFLHGTSTSSFCEEVCFDYSLYPISLPREEGFLEVSQIHTLYYATYGNPEGKPVIVLHGGPGAGCSDSLTQFFDLQHWNVIMFDQRGAMRSIPFCCMEENNSQHLISDIEALRRHLEIDKWVIFGGSWGSTLALLYGQEYPENCLGFILRGIFLGRKQDYLHLFYGMGKVFPEAYDQFLHYIPEDERSDLFLAYYRRVFDLDPEVHMPAARTFIRFNMTCATHLPNPTGVEKIVQNDRLVLSLTRAFFHYSKHEFFIEPNQILSRMKRLAHLPAIIVHGRWDAIDLPEMAYSLHKNWDNSKLWIVTEGGHSANDPAIAAALAKATDTLAQEVICYQGR